MSYFVKNPRFYTHYEPLLTSLLEFKPQLFKCALIAGENFLARGFQHRETSKTLTVNKQINNLKNNWQASGSRDSWCKVVLHSKISQKDRKVIADAVAAKALPNKGRKKAKDPKEVFEAAVDDTKEAKDSNKDIIEAKTRNKFLLAGQLNSFFRLTMEKDPILHNLPFASITARNFERSNYGGLFLNSASESFESLFLDKVFINDVYSYNPEVRFVPITSIIPCRVAFIGISEDNDPVRFCGDGRIHSPGHTDHTKTPEHVSSLGLVEMARHQRKFMDVARVWKYNKIDHDLPKSAKKNGDMVPEEEVEDTNIGRRLRDGPVYEVSFTDNEDTEDDDDDEEGITMI